MRLREPRIELQPDRELLDCQRGFAQFAVCDRKIAAIGRMVGALLDRAQPPPPGLCGLPISSPRMFGVVLPLRSVTVRRHAGAATERLPEFAKRAIGDRLERMSAEVLHVHGPDAR